MATQDHNRPLCAKCGVCYRAVNYHRAGRIYYRRLCQRCLQQSREQEYSQPQWRRQKITRKNQCERCGFQSDVSEIFSMYFQDGNLRNVSAKNVHTVCANCQIWLNLRGRGWQRSQLVSDF